MKYIELPSAINSVKLFVSNARAKGEKLPEYIHYTGVIALLEQEKCYDDAGNNLPSQHRGMWVPNSDGVIICSECEEPALQRLKFYFQTKTIDTRLIPSNYCPCCGAKMDNAREVEQ